MKPTLPSKKVQFWLIFTGLSFGFLVCLLWFWLEFSSSYYIDSHPNGSMLWSELINFLGTAYKYLIPETVYLALNSFNPFFGILLLNILFYIFTFWFFGIIIWVLKQYFKNKNQSKLL